MVTCAATLRQVELKFQSGSGRSLAWVTDSDPDGWGWVPRGRAIGRVGPVIEASREKSGERGPPHLELYKT